MSIFIMTDTRRITANLPGDLLDDAREVTGEGIRETLIEGLLQVKRRRFFERSLRLRGKLQLDINLEETRGRST